MNTFGFHSIHGRAPAVATGVKLADPSLSVWVVTGDGDGMSIGGNHLIHTLRRNLNLNILMFNNRIYGLTKGQYSPTSEVGKKTKSTPKGSLDYPFNPISLALGAASTFVARSIDKEIKHMGAIFEEAHNHDGTSFVEIYQNCNIFNDGAFSDVTDRATKHDMQLNLMHGEPMLFGAEKNKGIIMDGFQLKAVPIDENHTVNDILVHDMYDKNLAMLLSRVKIPVPIGVIYKENKPTYDDMFFEQLEENPYQNSLKELEKKILGPNPWVVK
tara:strand:- start:38 stop:850 length:813 start_codon:yes stop_codon:yes gene_type:complete